MLSDDMDVTVLAPTREARDAGIVEALNAEGATVAEVASSFGVSGRTVQRVKAAWETAATRQTPDVPVLAPEDVETLEGDAELGRALAALAAGERELRALAARTRQDAVAVAALRGAITAAVDRFRLVTEAGVVPEPAAVRSVAQVEALVEALFVGVRRLAEERGIDVEELLEAAGLSDLLGEGS